VKPRVRIRRIAGEVVYDVHHGRRRVTWPTWCIAMAHANRLAIAEQRARALLRGGRVG
jgi:hypothetical protein